MLFVHVCSAQTQAEINQSSLKDYEKADKELNATYKKIMLAYKGDTAFLNNLKASQRIWIQFRDAELKMKFPHTDEYGSMLPMCMNTYSMQLTQERTKHLKIWLTGIDEKGCEGSVKFIEK